MQGRDVQHRERGAEPEQALQAAKVLDRKKNFVGPFAGLPIAIKDVIATKGVRTTWGSLVYKDHIPGEDHILAERLKEQWPGLGEGARRPALEQRSVTFHFTTPRASVPRAELEAYVARQWEELARTGGTARVDTLSNWNARQRKAAHAG